VKKRKQNKARHRENQFKGRELKWTFFPNPTTGAGGSSGALLLGKSTRRKQCRAQANDCSELIKRWQFFEDPKFKWAPLFTSLEVRAKGDNTP